MKNQVIVTPLNPLELERLEFVLSQWVDKRKESRSSDKTVRMVPVKGAVILEAINFTPDEIGELKHTYAEGDEIIFGGLIKTKVMWL